MLNTTVTQDKAYNTPLYTTPANTDVSSENKIQDGLLYNWAAATNNKGGTTGWENVDNPTAF